MPRQTRPGAAPKLTRRRDGDPVKVFSDHRVAWWPSGVPGKGKRKMERKKTAQAAHEFAAAKYAEIDRHHAAGPESHVPLGEVFRRFVAFLRVSNTPQGTTDQYRSNWNCHAPETIADVACADLNVNHWTTIFEEMLIQGATKGTIRAVSRTLGAFITYAEDHNYFGDREAFGVSAHRRGKIVSSLAKKAPADADPERIGVEHCPAPETIHLFAWVAERVLPGYGYLLVLLAFASGLRFTECLGLRVEHIDAEAGTIRVVQQLNRYQAWPAVAPPKGGKIGTVQIWGAYRWVLVRLVEQAAAHTGTHAGWLFPPDRPVKRWADRVNRLINQDAVAIFNHELGTDQSDADEEWIWTFHWLRHAHASYGLASREQGGLGFSVTYVQKQLRHSKPSTTTDRYLTPVAAEGERATALSMNLPWDVPSAALSAITGSAVGAA